MAASYDPARDDREGSLRPHLLGEFLGQARLKENLAVFIQAARGRNEAMDHLFLVGPPGLGKTTLAQVVANELGVEWKPTSAPALDKPKDLAGILTSLKEHSVLFIDEIHRLKPAIEEMLYIAMEDFELDWIIGQGPSARTVRIPLPHFTMIGATTKPGAVSSPLASRFGISLRFGYYEASELESIVLRSAQILNVEIDADAATLLGVSCRGTPRIANRLLRRMRDFAQVGSSGRITRATVEDGLSRLEVDRLGLERMDREILRVIITHYAGGPVGAETLAISVGEGVDGLEDYYEPYLIQTGLLARTPRGRVVTQAAYAHLKMEAALEKDGPGEDGRLPF
ncbi:MAG: Holliday junction branch migration DNA helicase RuvB [Rectinemataceae bacterium]